MVAKSIDMINFANKLIPLVKDEKEAHDMYTMLALEAQNHDMPHTADVLRDIASMEKKHEQELEKVIVALHTEARKQERMVRIGPRTVDVRGWDNTFRD